jgi:hypothetical protein
MIQMIEVKTAELSGPALRWAVAQAEGLEVTIHPPAYGNGHRLAVNGRTEAYRPDMDWSQSGPLIEKHRIGFGLYPNAYFACTGLNDCGGEASGPTHLIAACRAIVSAKLGETVAVPAELLP